MQQYLVHDFANDNCTVVSNALLNCKQRRERMSSVRHEHNGCRRRTQAEGKRTDKLGRFIDEKHAVLGLLELLLRQLGGLADNGARQLNDTTISR